MNNKILLAVTIMVIVCSSDIIAQKGSWKLKGNNLGGTEKLGSLNNFDLKIFTDNIQRMVVKGTSVATNGYVGVGTASPAAKLHVSGAAGFNPFQVQIANSTKLYVHSGGGVSVGSPGTPPANGLFVNGNTGIGIANSTLRLNVVGGADAGPGGGGFIVAGALNAANVAIDDNEIMARSNGATSSLFLNQNGGDIIMNGTNSTGNVGIGTAPDIRLHVRQAIANKAIEYEHESSGDFWTVGIGTNTLNTLFLFNGIQKAAISSANGAYLQGSDLRLKKDIEPINNLLDQVMLLKPSKYFYKEGEKMAKAKSFGFIAQDVDKVFPELVYDLEGGYKSLDYSGFGVIAIKAIQELKPVVEEQKLRIATLEDRIAKLETMIASLTADKNIKSGFNSDDVSLDQNTPNPFNSNTTIRYRLPQGAAGQINIFDATGSLVKTLTANQSGIAQINASDLKPGTYTYTLMVNGKIGGSKKLVLAR